MMEHYSQAYKQQGCQLVGFDPAGNKFKKYYPDHIGLIPDFFQQKHIVNILEKRRKLLPP